jgi:hypothetical protein
LSAIRKLVRIRNDKSAWARPSAGWQLDTFEIEMEQERPAIPLNLAIIHEDEVDPADRRCIAHALDTSWAAGRGPD